MLTLGVSDDWSNNDSPQSAEKLRRLAPKNPFTWVGSDE